jgi:two-component system, NarL family, sensor histidine kinase DegS
MLPGQQTPNPVDELQRELQAEIDQCRSSLKDMNLLLEQSKSELVRLTQKNAAITGHIQQIQPQLENMSRSEIKSAYLAALDAQQRLLLTRGQIEKLQSDQKSLQKNTASLERISQILTDSGLGSKKGEGVLMLEMVMDAQESERRRLSNQMHDGPAQTISNLIVQAEIASKLFDIDQNRARDELMNLKEAARTTLQKVRSFIAELRPMMLDDLGVFPTLEHYIKSVQEQNQVEINYRLNGQARRLEPYLEVMLFRAVQELIGNACRYNQENLSQIKIEVLIVITNNIISVTVSDNGIGFDSNAIVSGSGLGLKLIRERVEALDGQLQTSSKPGEGAVVSFQVPCLELKQDSDTPKF